MVEVGTVSEVSKMSIRLSAAFSVIGVALLYLYIAVTDASLPTKVLWSATLSLGVAMVFIVVWTIARDVVRNHEREERRRT
jgi:peptidoglycan/LPS O-acetylase OafA/YrhL